MKSALKSKVLWFNVAFGLVWTAMAASSDPSLHLPPAVMGGIQTVGNMVLRFLTSQGVTIQAPQA